MPDEEKPSLSERYGVAVSAGSTRIATRASSGDVVLAAGMQSNTLGVMLLRLQAEYDSIRADLERAGEIAPRALNLQRAMLRAACDFESLAKRPGISQTLKASHYEHAERLREEAGAVAQRAPEEIKSARTFILLQLQSLRDSKQRIGAVALGMAEKRGVSAAAAMKLSGRVLDVYLDPVCHNCDGTGKIGSRFRGDMEKTCDTCNGTGHRRDVLGNDERETMFAGILFGELQRQSQAALGQMGKKMGDEPDGAPDPEAIAAMRQRLHGLRSHAAQSD